MKLNCGYETKKARVEMLPLIDVVFLLLVFFIYAMLIMVRHHSMKIDLPAAQTARADRVPHITISIDIQNQLHLNNAPVGINELPALIKALRTDTPDAPIFIDGDRASDFGIAIQLLDRLRESGIEEVSFSCDTSHP